MTAPTGGHTTAAPARAELWFALAAMLSFPDAGLADSVRSGRLLEEVEGAAATLPYGLAVDPGLGDPGVDLGHDPGADDGADDGAGALGSEYLRLFEVPGPSGRPCPLRIGASGPDRRAVMEEMLRFYRHFGLTTAGAAAPDLPDSVPTVAEFLAFLVTLEAGAPPGGERSAARTAQRDVLERHLAPAAGVIVERVGRLRPPPLYRAATALLAAYASAEVAALRS